MRRALQCPPQNWFAQVSVLRELFIESSGKRYRADEGIAGTPNHGRTYIPTSQRARKGELEKTDEKPSNEDAAGARRRSSAKDEGERTGDNQFAFIPLRGLLITKAKACPFLYGCPLPPSVLISIFRPGRPLFHAVGPLVWVGWLVGRALGSRWPASP